MNRGHQSSVPWGQAAGDTGGLHQGRIRPQGSVPRGAVVPQRGARLQPSPVPPQQRCSKATPLASLWLRAPQMDFRDLKIQNELD